MVVAIIGVGMIGGALAKSLTKGKHEDGIVVADLNAERLSELKKLGIPTTSSNREAAGKAEIIILCVKPKDVEKVLNEIKNETNGKTVISFAAAVRLGMLKKASPQARFVRAMPNIAILVQESFTAYCCDPDVTLKDKGKAEAILSKLGRFVEMEEKDMDAITGLSGCAPAYLSMILEALTYGGLEAGLSKDVALRAAAQSMVGTGRLVLEAGKHPSEIREMATTPGGVTIEGLRELEKVPIRHAFMAAVRAATAKSRKMSETLAGV